MNNELRDILRSMAAAKITEKVLKSSKVTVAVTEKSKSNFQELTGVSIDQEFRCETIDEISAESVDVVVCAYPFMSRFNDDVFTICDYCGCEVVHRPESPLSPPKSCLDCADKIIKIGEEKNIKEFAKAAKIYVQERNRTSS